MWKKGTPGADGLEQLTGSFFFTLSFFRSLSLYIIAARRRRSRRRKAVENNQKPV
jgi:hypothetical protein